MRCLALAVFAGCTFTQGALSGDRVDASANKDTALIDTAQMIDGQMIDAPVTPDAFVAPMCTTTITNGLTLCLELDDPNLATALDSSGNGHNATISNVAVGMRDVPAGSQAAEISSTSSIVVPDSTDWNAQTFTLMAWVRRDSAPTNGMSYGIIDVGAQYYTRIDSQGRIYCAYQTGNVALVLSGPTIPLNQWVLIGCTSTSQNVCTWMFTGASGGAASGSGCGNTQNNTINTSPNDGITIGSSNSNGAATQRLDGAVDSIKVYNRVLSESEICMAGGRSGC